MNTREDADDGCIYWKLIISHWTRTPSRKRRQSGWRLPQRLPLNLALAKEVPAIGAVVCHELAKQRKPTDSLPAYIAMNLAGNQAGLIDQGFLSAEFGPMSLSIGDGPPNLSPQKGMEETFRRRRERLLFLSPPFLLHFPVGKTRDRKISSVSLSKRKTSQGVRL